MKIYWKILIGVASFIISIFAYSLLLNHGTTDMTEEMSDASLPTVCFIRNGYEINPMAGNISDMDYRFVFDGLTYLGEGRSLTLKVKKFDEKIESLRYEVRTLDGERLIEDTEITSYQENKENIQVTFSIKDLIEKDNDYSFVVILTLEDGREVKYYARIATEDDEKIDEKLSFVNDFSAKTFDKEAAMDLTKYLESNASGDNTNYSHVNIHSSFDQITWGNLKIMRETEPVSYIDEMGSSTGQIRLEYMAGIKSGKYIKHYNITEYYRIRYGSERIYLLDFDREMNQMYFEENHDVYGDKIMLGITDSNLQTMESADAHTLAFVQERTLFVVNMTNNFLARAFSFYDYDSLDERTLNRNHDIKILNIDEAGNVTFMVYGYMSRGNHEGMTGIDVLTFNSATNTLDERIFIPCSESFEMIKNDVETLSHLNGSGILILFLNHNVYSVNLESCASETVVSNVTSDTFKVSTNNNIIAWLDGEDENSSASLTMRNLTTGKTSRIQAPAGDWIRAVGFMGEDLIYGIAHKEDVRNHELGKVLFPMHELRIQNEIGGMIKSYSDEGCYITNCEIQDNMITLYRMVKGDHNEFKEFTSDTILSNNENEVKEREKLEIVSTENSKKIVQVVLRYEMKDKTVKYMHPKFILFEGERQITLGEHNKERTYLVYHRGELLLETESVADALSLAYEQNGVVLNNTGSYVWKKGNLLPKNQIMAISGQSRTEEKSSLAVCLETIALFEGYSIKAQPMLDSGKTAKEIMAEVIPNSDILDLTGCPMDAMLSYVNKDIPILAIDKKGEAVLIIGFNDLNTVWMNPENGKVYKVGMNDSREYFEKNGNQFVTYLREK